MLCSCDSFVLRAVCAVPQFIHSFFSQLIMDCFQVFCYYKQCFYGYSWAFLLMLCTNEVWGPTALSLSGNLLEMQNLRPCPRSAKAQSAFSGRFLHAFKFEKHWLSIHMHAWVSLEHKPPRMDLLGHMAYQHTLPSAERRATLIYILTDTQHCQTFLSLPVE